MNRFRMTVTAVLIVLLAAPVLGAGPGSVQKRIQKAYENLKDIQGEFRQESRIKELDETREASGRFYIRWPGRLRWDYVDPSRQTVVIMGEEMYVRQEGEKEVMQGRFDSESYGQTPMSLLAGLADMERDFIVKPSGPTSLLLIPRKSMGTVQSIRIGTSASSFPVESIQLVDVYGNVNTFNLVNVRMNKGLGDEIFVP